MKNFPSLLLLLGALSMSSAIAAQANLQWQEEKGKSVSLLKDGKPLWGFSFAPELVKSYFHPLCTADGYDLTWLSPSDHVWHYALWHSWKLINGVNYWELNKTGRPDGCTDIVGTQLELRPDFTAVIRMQLTYHLPDKPVLMSEERTITVTPPDERGEYRIDWQMDLKVADQPVTLDCTPSPKRGGPAHGGYGGLSFRATKEMKNYRVIDSTGWVNEAKVHGRGEPAQWMDFSGTLDAAGQAWGGITFFDHPANPRHPTPWYVIQDGTFGYFCPSIFFNEPLPLKAGEQLTLRYRALIHGGKGDKAALDKEFAAYAKPIRVLLLTGKNNHDWKATTPVLEKMYKDSGHFNVDTTTEPAKFTAEMLKAYDVIVSNWTNWPNVNEREWGAEAEKAFMDFIRGGKGVVFLHAAGSVFYTWPEFRELAGSWWEMNQTGHGSVHEFTVKMADADHPITRGLKAFQTRDELWHRMGTTGKLNVLCTAFSDKNNGGSGQDEPVVHWRTLGQGRCFYNVLGHDGTAMSTPGFQILTLRGTEWAATGVVTIAPPRSDTGALFDQLKSYRAGESRAALTKIEKLVRQASGDAAERAKIAVSLAEVLKADATPDAKAFVCEQLSIVGDDTTVDAIAPLLKEEKLNQAARFALERIGTPAAAKALRDTLKDTKGTVRTGIVTSLGSLRDAAAVPLIQALVAETDAAVNVAALHALGQIGTPEAADALKGAQVDAALAGALQDARLNCALRLTETGAKDRAAAILEPMRADQAANGVVRLAAFRGLLEAQPERAEERVLEALAGSDANMAAAAATHLASSRTFAVSAKLTDQWDKLPAQAKRILLDGLAQRGKPDALPLAAKGIADTDAGVRRAALICAGATGDATTVAPLLKAAASNDDDRKVAMPGLVRLRGDGVDAAIVEAAKAAEPKLKAELIRVLGERSARSVLPFLLAEGSSGDSACRKGAFSAISKLVKGDDLPELLKLQNKLTEDDDLQALEPAILTACRAAGIQAGALVAGLDQAPPAVQATRLRLLSTLGGAEALATLRERAKASKEPAVVAAAIRGLADWPDATPLADLLALANDIQDLQPHVLAVRGALRMASKQPQKDALPILKQLATLARRDEEKAQIQSAIQRFGAVNIATKGKASNPDGLAKDGEAGGPQAAIDGNPATYWDEVDGQKLYILRVDLPAKADVLGLRITGYQHHNFAPKDFQVLCDGKVVKEVRSAIYQENVLNVDLPKTSCQAVELKITGYYGGSPAIRELEILAPAE